MYYVEYDESHRVWTLQSRQGRLKLTFESAIVTPKSGEFEGKGVVRFHATHGLVIPPEMEEAMYPNEVKTIAPVKGSTDRMWRATVQLNSDGTWEQYSV